MSRDRDLYDDVTEEQPKPSFTDEVAPDHRTAEADPLAPSNIQLAQPKRETPSGWIHAVEWNRIVPAARCKECGNITWKLSLSGGPEKLVDTKKHGPVHQDGCSKPNGRLDRKHRLLND